MFGWNGMKHVTGLAWVLTTLNFHIILTPLSLWPQVPVTISIPITLSWTCFDRFFVCYIFYQFRAIVLAIWADNLMKMEIFNGRMRNAVQRRLFESLTHQACLIWHAHSPSSLNSIQSPAHQNPLFVWQGWAPCSTFQVYWASHLISEEPTKVISAITNQKKKVEEWKKNPLPCFHMPQ